LNLSFIAVVEFGTSKKKIDLVKQYGGNSTVAHAGESIVKKAKEMEKNISNSFFMNQFAHGQVAEDFFFCKSFNFYVSG
jgi:cysteine synthase